MPLFAIIPVKPLAEGKSRLSGHLADADRRALNARFLDRTLTLAGALCPAERIIVVSRDETVLAMARAQGSQALAEPAGADLNIALAAATALARAKGAGALLILPVDLPLARAERLRSICAQEGPAVILVADRHGSGTNLLFQRPLLLPTYQFGPGSLALHAEAAQRAGCVAEIFSLPDLSLDIDTPDDLSLWRSETCPIRHTAPASRPAG